MTIAPFGLPPMAPLSPAPASPAGTGDSVPADFLAAIQAAMSLGAPGDIEPVEMPAAEASAVPAAAAPAAGFEAGASAPAPQPTAGGDLPVVAPRLDKLDVPKVDVEPVETPVPDAQTQSPLTLDPALAALVVLQAPVTAPRLDKLDDRGVATPVDPPRLDKLDDRGVATPVDPSRLDKLDDRGVATPVAAPRLGKLDDRGVATPIVAPRLDKLDDRGVATPIAAPRLDKLDVPEAATPVVAPRLDKLDVPARLDASPVQAMAQPSAPPQIQPPIQTTEVHATAALPPAAHTSPMDRVSAQVFPEVTSLVSRGSGTHRITLTLNPEQLGEVRVVMTMRGGAVHVRLAAGQEARASLAEGTPELSRLLERAGATEARVVVRELPATALSSANPSTPTTDTSSSTLGGDRSPDQHAGTRADHQARDGSDHHTPRSVRTAGQTAPGATQRSIEPVTGVRTAAVDLTM